MTWLSFRKGASVVVFNVTNLTVVNGISEEQMASLKEALNAGIEKITDAVREESAQHAAKIDELAAQFAAGDLTPEELSSALTEVASKVRGIVPDAAVEPPAPPAGTGE